MGFLQDLDIETPPLGTFSIGQLIARIDRSWDTRKEITKSIAKRLPDLQTRAMETNRLIIGLLREQETGQVHPAA